MKTKDTKILFTDLDDTLLTTDKNVSALDLASIKKLTEAGHKFVVSTGRPFYSANKLCQDFGFIGPGFYVIASNGGIIYDYDKKDFILKRTVSLENVAHVFDLARKANLHIQTYTDDYVACEHDNEEIRSYSGKIKMPYKVLNKIPDDLPYEPPKMIVISLKGRKALIPFEEKLHPWIDGKMDTVFSADTLLEILPLGVSKGDAVKTLCKHFDIPIENSICCGDEENDISMIDAAGIGVVMKNGRDSVKAHANYITTRTNNESAISEVIEKFILN